MFTLSENGPELVDEKGFYMDDIKEYSKPIAVDQRGAQVLAAAIPSGRAQRRGELAQTLMALFKVRIVFLLLFTAVAGAFLAAGGWPGAGTLSLLLVTGGLAAGGASALNEYLEQDRDALMLRTRQRRPLVNGTITQPGWVPYVAVAMILVPSLLVLPLNPALSFFLLLGAIIYVGVYTLWLKPRTLLNIVIGGLAGSAAVLSGSAAAGVWNDPGALVLALLVFVWTPTHFWSLAMVYRDDYERGGVPMLPTQTTARRSAFWVLLHTFPTVLAALALASHSALGWLYFVPVCLASVVLIARNVRLVAEPTSERAFSLFKVSNVYLALVLLLICVDAVV
jgi:protoheme IX farnesyltransferase